MLWFKESSVMIALLKMREKDLLKCWKYLERNLGCNKAQVFRRA